MIFVTVGSQKFQFDRLLVEIDNLIKDKIIQEDVFAQIGVSEYKPKKYKYKDFLTQDEFNECLDKATLIITHAGTGVIVNAIKRDKKVIGVPRLARYGEHVDDHQIQLINEFNELGFIEAIFDINELKNAIIKVKNKEYKKYYSNNQRFLDNICNYINGSL